jgi:hypothetical protein
MTAMGIFNDMAHTFPLMRGGGVLFILVGLGVVIGGIGGRRWMLPALIVGFALAFIALFALSVTRLIFAGLGSPPLYQWIVMGIGIAVEIMLVNYVVFAITDRESRRYWLWILAAVGAHFLIFTFSHGPLAGLLGVLCLLNAFIGLRLKNVNYRVFWVISGILTFGIGLWMVLLSF